MGQQRETVIDLRNVAARAPSTAPHPASTARSTAFVLSGGATRGAIQVGMLRALTEQGITPQLVVGTSVGAMNAAVYVADATIDGIDRLDRIWGQARRSQIFPLAPRSIVANLRERRGYLFPNDGLRQWIETHLQHDRLEDYPIALHVVATDVGRRRPVTLSRGDALAALLASTAIPGVFPPVSIDGLWLHDGGVSADIPLPQALDLGPTTVYVLSTMADAPARPTAWQLLDRVFGQPPASQEIPPHPGTEVHWLPVPAFSGNPYSFRESRRLIDQAYQMAADHLTQLFGRTEQIVSGGR